ncbi:MAG: DoxX family protein [Gemmatimonadota bacterium]|nr:DoxX family protein [Gemmatimonadota bacterium]
MPELVVSPSAPGALPVPDMTAHSATSLPHITTRAAAEARHWSAPTRVAFRFCFVYFGLYVLTTQMLPGMLPIPGVNIPDLGSLSVVQAPVVWFGAHVLQLPNPISLAPSGSGDRMFDWVLALQTLIVAAITTIVWSVRSPCSTSHARLYKWFRFFMRWALATTMLSYGFAKVIPLQMPVLTLTKLVEPYGDFSPMSVLWNFIGSSAPYEVFIGCAEVFAGALLFWTRTTLFGIIVTLMDAIGIFALNMTYDVPVKLFSLHLILLSLVLLAPNIRTLYALLFLQQAAVPIREPALGRSAAGERRWTTLQVGFGTYCMLAMFVGSVIAWNKYGGGAATSPLFGIWSVNVSISDGILQPPLLTDSSRFRHVIFQRKELATMQKMDQRLLTYFTAVDTVAHTLTLTAANTRKSPTDTAHAKPTFVYQRVSKDSLILDGDLNGHRLHLGLSLRPHEKFPQLSRGFHWIQQNPLNR